MLKRLISGMALLGISSMGLADSLSGNYHCTGYDSITKGNYTAVLKISCHKSICEFDWHLIDGQHAKGRGLVADNIISAAYVIQNGKAMDCSKNVGVQQYVLDPKTHKLTGNWLEQGQDIMGLESCEKQ